MKTTNLWKRLAGVCLIAVIFSVSAWGAQEINVQGNSANILNNDSNPKTADGTDFGSTNTGGGIIDKIFTIQNTGDAALTVGTFTISGDFVLLASPAATVAAGGSTTFTIRFSPTASGTRDGTISFVNNDSNENPYNFSIRGTGVAPAPEINAQGANGVNIADGDTTPSTSDNTNFGSILIGSGTNLTFNIQNLGTAVLTVGTVAVTGDFNVLTQPSASVAIGGNTTFVVRFAPTAAGTRNGTISFANNDSNEDPYNFSITGTGVTPVPEINVIGVSDGGTDTSFGSTLVAGGTIDKTYTIENLGTASLTIGAFTMSGDFTVITSPAATVASGGSTTFTVRFDPSIVGTRNGTISFVNNDSNENQYNFSLTGVGTTAPVLAVSIPDQRLILNTAMTSLDLDNYFSQTEGDAITFTHSGLPAGLSYDNTTHIISGTPTAVGSTNVTITATDNDGNTQDTFTITVIQVTAASVQDICYDTPTYVGLACVDMGGFKGGVNCTQTIPLRNISGTTLSSVNTVMDTSAQSAGFFGGCGVDGVAGNCTQSTAINLGPIGIFNTGISYVLPDYSAGDSHSIYEYALVSMSIFSGTNLHALYNKGGAYYSANISACPVQIGWEQATYETAENTALVYGQSSQMPMKIVLDHAVDYPVSVTYQTYNGTAIGDVDYRIAGGTVTIPAGQTTFTVNMDIYHDEAIELAENFTVVLSNPTGSGGVSLRTDRTTAPVTIAEQNTSPMCYSDNFNAQVLDTSWRTLKSSGEFSPQIVSNRLRLTPATGNMSTAVTKDYEFASSENIIITEFTHYAYGGTGADGFALALYDTIVGANPTPGAFGGSLGYAQKSNPESDCTVTGGCPGFQGGWLGLGLDEYGNYQNPTEGRVGGTSFKSNAVSIRGNGSGTTGYQYLKGTNTLNPALWNSGNNPSPGDKFKMTVDARDPLHLYITLQRDTGSGSGYAFIINKFDAKLAEYNQTSTPNYVRLALTASTGGSNAIHEIDDITVWGRCTPYVPTPVTSVNTGAVDVVDNYPTGYTAQTGLKTKITSKPGNTLDAVWLGTTGGTMAVPYYTAGDNNVQNMPVLFYVSDINASNDNGACTTERYQLMSTGTTPLTATFTAGSTYARTTSTYTMQSTAKKESKVVPKYINFYGMYLLNTSNSCLINSSNSGNIEGMPQCVNSANQYKGAFGQAAVDRCLGTLNGTPCEPNNHGVGSGVYQHSLGCYQCTLDALAGTKGCSSDAFAIRPDRFAMSMNPMTLSPNLLKSGNENNITIHAYQFGANTDTADYNQSSANIDINVTKRNRDSTINNAMNGTGSFPAPFTFANGLTSNAAMTFNDVGKVTFALNDTNWAAVDIDDTALLDRTVHGEGNFTFIPFQFQVSSARIVDSSDTNLTYYSTDLNMSAKLDFNITSQNKQGITTQNFTNGLYEQNLSITPFVFDSLRGAANVSTINNVEMGFATGVTHVTWSDINTSRLVRFNFTRDAATPWNPLEINATEANVSVQAVYTDTGYANVTIENNSTNQAGATNGTTGNGVFLYGRADAPDYRFSNNPGCGRIFYEFFDTNNTDPIVTGIFGGAMPALSESPDANWYKNTQHNISRDGNVTATSLVGVITVNNQAGCGGTLSGGGYEKRGFTYTGANGYPFRGPVQLTSDAWLNVNGNNFGVEFYQNGAWVGEKKNTTATDNQAETISNRRIMW